MRIHFFQHVSFETPAAIGSWASMRAAKCSYTDFYKGGILPSLDGFDGLVIMGGPMGIYDYDVYPWLEAETRFIKEAIDAGKVVAGICLGAQLIAASMGSKVYKNTHKEIGWFPVTKTPGGREGLYSHVPDSLMVFHWHGDTYDLPGGAVLLAESEACRNQAFLYEGRVLGLQFHFETTIESIESLYTNCRNEIVPGEYIQQEEAIYTGQEKFGAENNEVLFRLLDNLFNIK